MPNPGATTAAPASPTTPNIRSHESKKMSDMITNHADIDVFIGIDVGKHNHHAVALDRDGKQVLSKALPQKRLLTV